MRNIAVIFPKPTPNLRQCLNRNRESFKRKKRHILEMLRRSIVYQDTLYLLYCLYCWFSSPSRIGWQNRSARMSTTVGALGAHTSLTVRKWMTRLGGSSAHDTEPSLPHTPSKLPSHWSASHIATLIRRPICWRKHSHPSPSAAIHTVVEDNLKILCETKLDCRSGDNSQYWFPRSKLC